MFLSIRSIISKLTAIFAAALAIFYYAKQQGEKEQKNNDNQKIANEVNKLGSIKKDTMRLSDAELDVELQKWKRVKNK
ncbi:MAG: hypothetical protein EBS06_05505 [Proteobacteria bacterium]|nr:hypothetical protein [Pseudomonadota bacterium]